MSAAHTPGPWRSEEGRVYSASGDILLTTPFVQRGERLHAGGAEANARLAAAAPEMLAALERAANDLRAIIEDDRQKVDPAFAFDRIEAAIAKAKGAK